MNVEWRQDPNYGTSDVLDLFVNDVPCLGYWTACWGSHNGQWRCKAATELASLSTKEEAQAWVLAVYSLGVRDEN